MNVHEELARRTKAFDMANWMVQQAAADLTEDDLSPPTYAEVLVLAKYRAETFSPGAWVGAAIAAGHQAKGGRRTHVGEETKELVRHALAALTPRGGPIFEGMP